MSSTKQLTTLLVIAGIIFTGFGYWVMPKIVGQTISKSANCPSLITGAGANLPVISNIGAINGKIKEIKDNQLVIEAFLGVASAAGQNDERVVNINSETKLYERAQKTPEQMNQEFADYEKSLKANAGKTGADVIMPPLPFNQEAINLGELKVGDQVMASADVNIFKLSEFTAKEIIKEQMIATAPLPTTPSAGQPVK